MPKQKRKPEQARQDPGPGRSTSDTAFNDLRRDIAERNEQAHQAARKLRAVREREQLLMRRQHDL